jgi:hypothetical protein
VSVRLGIAVLDTHPAGQVAHIAGRPKPARFTQNVGTLADLHAIAARLHASDGVTQLWLTPRFQRARAIAGLEHAWTAGAWAGDWPSAIVAPELNRRLRPVLEHASGAELLRTLELLSSTLGMGIQGAPAFTAELLLRGVLGRRNEAIALDELTAAACSPEPELQWIRPLDPDELQKPLLLAIDRRGAYLLSMVLCDVGLGAPESLEVLDWRRFVWTPGYYHARLKPWPELCVPSPLGLQPMGWHWVTMPTLRLLDTCGLVLEVDRAMHWPRKSRVLKPVADRIIKARQTFASSAPELVRFGDPLLKRAYTEMLGRLRWHKHRGGPLYRPDWHAHIVADSRSRVWASAAHFLHETGRAPAAANVDCWYVLADTPTLPPGFDPRFWRVDKTVPLEAVRSHFELDCPTYARGPVGALSAAVAHA